MVVNTRQPLTPERMDAIAALIAEGLTHEQIHQACGASRDTVRKVAAIRGLRIGFASHGGTRKGAGRKPSYKAIRRIALRASTPVEDGQPNYRAMAASLRWGAT